MITREYFGIRRANILDTFSHCTIIGTQYNNKKYEHSVPVILNLEEPQTLEAIITLRDGALTGLAGLRVPPQSQDFTRFGIDNYWRDHNALTGVVYDASGYEIPWFKQDAHVELYRHITDPKLDEINPRMKQQILKKAWAKPTRIKYLEDATLRCIFPPQDSTRAA